MAAVCRFTLASRVHPHAATSSTTTSNAPMISVRLTTLSHEGAPIGIMSFVERIRMSNGTWPSNGFAAPIRQMPVIRTLDPRAICFIAGSG